MAQRTFYLGIDLGTTNSAAAVFDGERISVVRTTQGTLLTPSIVRYDSRGALTVGAKAAKFLDSDPKNTRAEFKRLMGTSTKLDFPAAKLAKLPEELSAEVLRSLRNDVKDQYGFLPDQAVISVPALFELPQSAATTKAAQLAGFTKVELIQEPIASALAAGWTASEGSGYWLVYDLGGGTFDASLLETRDGMLRVVGHDGDNFLGGRDFDWAIVDWLLEQVSRQEGIKVSRADAKWASAIRKLKHAAEEAKIELTRSDSADISVPEFIEHDGRTIEVMATLDRSQLEQLTAPLVLRSIEVCQRLLKAQQVDALTRIVLVGGPTMMPWLRQMVKDALHAPFAEGLDPMTLVAQGAAVYAATAGLDMQPAKAESSSGCKLWLQFPAMSSDMQPYIVGKLLPEDKPQSALPQRIRLVRADGLWQSPDTVIDPEGGFVLQVELLPRRPNIFKVEGLLADGKVMTMQPATVTIVQGLTIADPPLSRTIGVARANNTVQVFFEKGTPLPARRTISLTTVESVAPAGAGSKEEFALKIPVVQGEYEQAHLCRLVGTLEIRSSQIKASLPGGSQVQVSLEVDRGGQLSARALVPTLNQLFEHVAQLLVPEASIEVLEASLKSANDRIAELRTSAFRQGQKSALERLHKPQQLVTDLERDISAAKGGDADAAQKARRSLIELDAMLEELEVEKHWPELSRKAMRQVTSASFLVTRFGTDSEKRLLSDVVSSVEKAQARKDIAELQRQLRLANELAMAAYYRDPDVWEDEFKEALSHVERASDQAKAQSLVQQGHQALAAGDNNKLRDIVEKLWKLLPASAEQRRQGYDSGVR
ncbi:MAG TPA: Hsp70 family protein [Pseudomonadota bacterium]|jgi:molecular chaperone DnaK|nr:Hsp70 family protein [Pseudomonadota bacterium]HNK46352.1 Hsp70 family protein [Pseudomonadota bacterium]HNN50577.1 Hsp70 family protein [Pseudomonadota bacterium]HNO68620.1 Hsp70 family protein [Pseudomonadota bacterium]